MTSKTNLLGMSLAELQELCLSESMPKFAAKQICDWLYNKRVDTIDGMTNLSLKARSRLNEIAFIGRSTPVNCQVSKDGTKKYLFEIENGESPTTTNQPHPDNSQFSILNSQFSILFELLRPYHFNAATVADILSATENGKHFHSPTHIAELHQGKLLIAPKEAMEQTANRPTEEGVRPWRPGDRIKLNTNHSKLLSDYLKDLGLSRIERQNLLVRVNEDGFVELIADDLHGRLARDDK